MNEPQRHRPKILVFAAAVGRATSFVLQIGMTAIGAGTKGNAPLLPPQPPPKPPDQYRP